MEPSEEQLSKETTGRPPVFRIVIGFEEGGLQLQPSPGDFEAKVRAVLEGLPGAWPSQNTGRRRCSGVARPKSSPKPAKLKETELCLAAGTPPPLRGCLSKALEANGIKDGSVWIMPC